MLSWNRQKLQKIVTFNLEMTILRHKLLAVPQDKEGSKGREALSLGQADEWTSCLMLTAQKTTRR